MKKTRIECSECHQKKVFTEFDDGMDVCNECVDEMHKQALAFSAKAERVNKEISEAKRELAREAEQHRASDRTKAPPREYPYPWGPKKR